MKRFLKGAALALTLFIFLPRQVSAASLLIPVGEVIGISVEDQTVTVAAFDEGLGAEARAAGLSVGDQLLKIDKTPIRQPEDLRKALRESDGTVDLEILRDGKLRRLSLTPRITDDGPKLGVYLKQGVSGIGTVTWYDPATGTFGALGHGVNTPAGDLVRMDRGNIYQARVASVKKGVPGTPGQLLGSLEDRDPLGELRKNTEQGIFGKSDVPWQGIPLPVAQPTEVRTGIASILATVQGTEPQEYSVEILRIYPAERSNGRNLLLRVIDPALLESTGGIVQGMSGSPIIQDGKLVGAVTHVLVNDPTTGYGIFIENMLDAAA